jgi:hypothetical protein
MKISHMQFKSRRRGESLSSGHRHNNKSTEAPNTIGIFRHSMLFDIKRHSLKPIVWWVDVIFRIRSDARVFSVHGLSNQAAHRHDRLFCRGGGGFALLMTFSRHRSRADRVGHKNVNRGHSWLTDFVRYLSRRNFQVVAILWNINTLAGGWIVIPIGMSIAE